MSESEIKVGSGKKIAFLFVNSLLILVAVMLTLLVCALRTSGEGAPADTTVDPSVTVGGETVYTPPEINTGKDTSSADTTSGIVDTQPVTYPPATVPPVTDPPVTEPPIDEPAIGALPVVTDSTIALGSGINSDHGILYSVSHRKIIASKRSSTRIYPASMTKVMTLYTAIKHIDPEKLYTDTYEMTAEIINPLYLENATRAGFAAGEDVLLIDYLYGAILPSGADACIALAEYVAGSEKAFAELMTEEAKALGLKNSNFTNVTGLHGADHYSTVYDMAMILSAALENDICHTVLTTHKYTTHATAENPSGITLYSTALSRASNYSQGTTRILGGKTGFTPEAKQCLATYAEDISGNGYIFVSAHCEDKWSTLEDALYVYKTYATVN